MEGASVASERVGEYALSVGELHATAEIGLREQLGIDRHLERRFPFGVVWIEWLSSQRHASLPPGAPGYFLRQPRWSRCDVFHSKESHRHALRCSTDR